MMRMLLEGGSSLNRRAIFWHSPHYHGSTWAPGAAIRAGDWKLIEFYEEGETELYRLSDDPSERAELSEKLPGKKAELQELLLDLQRSTGAKMPESNPGYRKDVAQ